MYFDGTRAPTRRLHQFVVLQKIPSIRVLPVWDEELAKSIATCMLAAKGKSVAAVQQNKLANGTLTMPLKIMMKPKILIKE